MIEKIEDLKQVIEALGEIAQKLYLQLEASEKRARDAEKNLKERERSLNEARADINRQKEQIDELKHLPDDVANYKARIKTLEYQIWRANQLSDKEEEIKKLNADLKAKETELNETISKLQIWTTVETFSKQILEKLQPIEETMGQLGECLKEKNSQVPSVKEKGVDTSGNSDIKQLTETKNERCFREGENNLPEASSNHSSEEEQSEKNLQAADSTSSDTSGNFCGNKKPEEQNVVSKSVQKAKVRKTDEGKGGLDFSSSRFNPKESGD